MKPLTAALILIVTASIAFSQSQSEPPILSAQDSIQTLLTKIQSFYPRLEGTEGEASLLNAGAEYFRQLGLEVSRRDFSSLDSGHSFSSVLEARLQGEREDTLLVIAPANHLLETTPSNDGTINIAALLSAARRLAESTPPVTVRFLLLGAERGRGSDYPLGSRLILQQYFPEHPVAALYLSLRSPGDTVSVDTGSGGRISPKWLLERTVSALTESETPFRLSQAQTQIARAAMRDERSAIAPYLAQEFPAIGFESSPDGVRSSGEAPESVGTLADAITRLVRDSSEGLQTTWDSHYVFFETGDRYIFIPERSYIVLLLAVVFATSLYGIVYRRRFDRYARTIARNFWSLPGLYFLAFGVLVSATLIVQYYLEARGYAELWEHYPLVFFGAKVALTLFLFTLLFQWIQRLPISRNGSFYSASAIALLFVGIVILAAINIAFSYYFLWAYMFAFIFSVTRIRLLKALALLLAPVWLILEAVDLFSLPALRSAGSLLFSPIVGNLVLALVILPFLMMFIRLDFLIRHPMPGQKSFAVQLVTLLTATGVAVSLIYIQSVQPFDGENPQPVRVTHRMNASTDEYLLEGESPAPLGVFPLRYGGETLEISTNDRSFTREMEESALPWRIEQRSNSFLSRREHVVTIDTERRAYSIEARLRSTGDLVLLEANFPFELEPEIGRATFYIGRYPPNPLELRFTVTAQTSADLILQAQLPGLGRAAGIINPDYRLLTEQNITQTIDIGE